MSEAAGRACALSFGALCSVVEALGLVIVVAGFAGALEPSFSTRPNTHVKPSGLRKAVSHDERSLAKTLVSEQGPEQYGARCNGTVLPGAFYPSSRAEITLDFMDLSGAVHKIRKHRPVLFALHLSGDPESEVAEDVPCSYGVEREARRLRSGSPTLGPKFQQAADDLAALSTSIEAVSEDT